MTAVDRVDSERIDHQGYVPEIWTGLLVTALYMMQRGPIIETLNDRLEDVLSLTLFVGSLVCLVGVALGTKWFFRKASRKISYGLEVAGLPLIIIVMAWLTYASVDTSEFLLTALAGGLGLFIEIGCVRMMVDLIDELNGD